jgi:hypothetical protein
MNIAFLIGRIIFGGYWLMASFNHFKNLNYMSEYAKAKGTPSPKLAGPERRMRELLFAHRHCGLCPRKRDLGVWPCAVPASDAPDWLLPRSLPGTGRTRGQNGNPHCA